jgi:hypothetical protein
MSPAYIAERLSAWAHRASWQTLFIVFEPVLLSRKQAVALKLLVGLLVTN